MHLRAYSWFLFPFCCAGQLWLCACFGDKRSDVFSVDGRRALANQPTPPDFMEGFVQPDGVTVVVGELVSAAEMQRAPLPRVHAGGARDDWFFMHALRMARGVDDRDRWRVCCLRGFERTLGPAAARVHSVLPPTCPQVCVLA